MKKPPSGIAVGYGLALFALDVDQVTTMAKAGSDAVWAPVRVFRSVRNPTPDTGNSASTA